MTEISISPLQRTDDFYITEQEIQDRVWKLSQELNAYYQDEPLTILTVLNGAVPFARDLKRGFRPGAEWESVRAKSYEGTESAKLNITGVPEIVTGRVLLVEDILDTGRTLHGLIGELTMRGASGVDVVTLLEKPGKREKGTEFPEGTKTHVGFEIPDDKFVIGYGLDYDGDHRELPYITICEPHKDKNDKEIWVPVFRDGAARRVPQPRRVRPRAAQNGTRHT